MYFISCKITIEGKLASDPTTVTFVERTISGIDIDNFHLLKPGICDIEFIESLSNQVLDDFETSIYRTLKATSDLVLKVYVKTSYTTTNWFRPSSHLSEEFIARLVKFEMEYEFDCNDVEELAVEALMNIH